MNPFGAGAGAAKKPGAGEAGRYGPWGYGRGRIAPLITPTSPGDYKKQLQAGTPGRKHRLIVSDMRKFGPESMRTALNQAVTLQPPEGGSRCVVALIDPSNIDQLRKLTPADEEHTVVLRLATTDGLRSRTAEQDPMAPFSEHTLRVALLESTGGWASLLNHALLASFTSTDSVCSWVPAAFRDHRRSGCSREISAAPWSSRSSTGFGDRS